MITHTFDSYQIPSHNKTKWKLQIWKVCQIFKFWNLAKKLYTRHTFWSCLRRCVNMKWIWEVLWKLQSGHDSVHRWTDTRTDNVKPVYPFQLRWSDEYNNLHLHSVKLIKIVICNMVTVFSSVNVLIIWGRVWHFENKAWLINVDRPWKLHLKYSWTGTIS